ncbi:MAG TPA: hypothetical protein EYH39_00610 [Desulfurobacteriaceae bacterium]|nr:hypothetical protein [Desulfurobacteriaceae bacterium]
MLEINKIENISPTSQVKADQKQVDVQKFSQIQTQKYVKTTYESSKSDIANFLQKHFPKQEFVAVFKGFTPEGKALLELGKYTFEAQVLTALKDIKEGDVLVLKVKSLKPNIELELINIIKPKEEILKDYLKSTLLSILEGKENLLESLKKLNLSLDLSKIDSKTLKELLNSSQIALLYSLLKEYEKNKDEKIKDSIYELLSLIFLNSIQDKHLQFTLPLDENSILDLHFYKEGEKYRFVMDFLISNSFLKIEGILFLNEIYILAKTNSKEFFDIFESTKGYLKVLLEQEGLKVKSLIMHLEDNIKKEEPLNYIYFSEGILINEKV